FFPSFIRAIGPAALWFIGFAVFWLTGLYGMLPIEGQATAGVIFWVGLVCGVLIGLRVWKVPTDDNARDLIDGAIEGRPLSVWVDRPSRADTHTYTLWHEHRDRMAALAAKLGKFEVAPHWRQADPLYLRLVAPTLVVIAVVIANTQTID